MDDLVKRWSKVLFDRRRNPELDRQLREEVKEEILAELACPPYGGWEQTAYRREKESLRRELLDDLRRSGPAVPGREALKRDIMREAWDMGLTPEELYSRLTGGRAPSWRGQLKGLVTSRQSRSFGWGVGLTLAAVLLAPSARRHARPAARKVLEEAMDVAARAQRFLTEARENLEDLVAEAKFHQLETAAENKDAPSGSEPAEG